MKEEDIRLAEIAKDLTIALWEQRRQQTFRLNAMPGYGSTGTPLDNFDAVLTHVKASIASSASED